MRAPEAAVAELREALADAAGRDLPANEGPAFLARADESLGTLLPLLDELYGSRVDPVDLAAELLREVLALSAVRAPDLRALDRSRERDPGWFLAPRMVGYVCYADRYAGTLAGVRERLDHLAGLGVTYLHLMPVLRPREGESDGGYAVADYDAVDPRLGDMADLTALAGDLHARGMALCVDLVLNHTAREHVWAQAAMTGDAERKAYYLVFPDRTLPDEYERTAPDIFPVLAPGTFTHVDEMGGWVWTTFREFQWDLDYTNPAVFAAMLRTMLTLANRGADVLRLDAAPFLWKRVGTTCMNQPEAHLLLQAFRSLMAVGAPGVLLKAEAMVEPDLLTPYLGAHADGYRPECHLAYDNQLMVMLWATLASGSSALVRQALARRPAAPEPTTWVTYLRCHDDIGWAVADADAEAVGLDGTTYRAWLSRYYAGGVEGSFSRGLDFQPSATGSPPTCGSAASLCGVQAAVEAGDEAALDAALARLESLYSIVFSHGGIPLVYMGDELAMLNDEGWADDPAHRGDNRWVQRPVMDWVLAAAARGDRSTPAGRTYAALSALARTRAATPALRSDARTVEVDVGDDGVYVYRREAADGSVLVAVVEVAGLATSVDLERLGAVRLVHTGIPPARVAGGVLELPPHGFGWLVGDA